MNVFAGDVAETIKKYCDLSSKVDSDKTSSLTLQEVDTFLDELSTLTKEDEQTSAFSKLCEKANGDDLKVVSLQNPIFCLCYSRSVFT